MGDIKLQYRKRQMESKTLPPSKHLETWQQALSAKKPNLTSKARKAVVNQVWLLMDKTKVWVHADHEKGVRKSDVNINIAGGISAEAVVCGLRLIIELLEREGLPLKPARIKYQHKKVASQPMQNAK